MESNKGNRGYGMDRLFKCLLYQFMEDLSDRQLEEALKTNCVAKWFCEFGLADKTPDHSLFGEVRKRIGTKKLSKLFAIMKEQLREQGYMRDKNKDLDKWRAKIRSPFERVFSKRNKRVRYLGIAKNQFAEFMNAFSFNIKRLAVIS